MLIARKLSPAAFQEEFSLSVLKGLKHFAKVDDLRLSPVFVKPCHTDSHRRAAALLLPSKLNSKIALCGVPVDIPLFPSSSISVWGLPEHLKRVVSLREMSGPFRAVVMARDIEENDTWRLFHGEGRKTRLRSNRVREDFYQSVSWMADLYKYQTLKVLTGQFCTIEGDKAVVQPWQAEGLPPQEMRKKNKRRFTGASE